MKKQILSLALAAALVMSTFSLHVCAAEPMSVQVDATQTDAETKENLNDVTEWVAEGKAVAFTETNFPDAELRQCLQDGGYVKDGYIYPEGKTSLTLGNTLGFGSSQMPKQYKIYDLAGLEYFVNLENLYIARFFGDKMDLSNFPRLKTIKLAGWGMWGAVPNLKELDTSKNSLLERLDVQRTGIEKLDITQNSNIQYLNCEMSDVKQLKLGNNPKLEYISCGDSSVSELNLTGCTNLQYFSCYNSNIKKLDFSKCLKLGESSYYGSCLELGNYDNYDSIIFDKNCKASVRLETEQKSSLFDLSKIYGPNFSGKAYDPIAKMVDLDELEKPDADEGYSNYFWNSKDNGTNMNFSLNCNYGYFDYNEEGTVTYQTHVQSIGWQNAVKNGQMAGTSGKAKRLEGIKISVSGVKNLGIKYTTHVQTYGWLPWSKDGEMSGTEGEAKRLEAIKIQLTGVDKSRFDVYYRVHAQSYGWLGWAKNGEPAGTAGYGKRLEAIQIIVTNKALTESELNELAGNIASVRKESYVAKAGTSSETIAASTPNVMYQTHVQTYGWQNWKYNGVMSGTSGEAKRLEGINIKLTNKPYSGSVVYTTHVQTYGWQGNENDITTWKRDGQMSGTSGEAKRLEAIRISLTGEMAKHYDIYYRVHAQTYGWLAWTKNGAPAGTAGYAKRLEGIQVVLVPKGASAPANNYKGISSVRTQSYIKK